MKNTTNANNRFTTTERIVGTIATGALIFGVAYGAATLLTPTVAPLLCASSVGIGVILGMTFKGRKKAAEVTA